MACCRRCCPAAGRGSGVVVASVLFGLWHVLPSWSLGDVNPVVDDLFGEGWPADVRSRSPSPARSSPGCGCASSAYRSGSVLAPMMAHVATNSIAYAIAWFVS